MPGTAGSNFGLIYGYSPGEAWDINPDFKRLDVLAQLAVVSAALTSPPGSPATGDRYIVAAPATGAWAGKENQVARYNGSTWDYCPPSNGQTAYDSATGIRWLFSGSAWVNTKWVATAFIPASATVPTNGMYLPTTNTLGWSVNTTAEMQMTGTALSPATSDGLALGTTALMWSDAFLASGAVLNFNNGDVTVTHSADTLTVAGGGLSLTGAGTGLAVTNNATIGGTVITTGSETAAAFIPASATIPTNGMYLPVGNTLGWATNSAERVRLNSSGNLGVGTVNPVARLTVVHNTIDASGATILASISGNQSVAHSGHVRG